MHLQWFTNLTCPQYFTNETISKRQQIHEKEDNKNENEEALLEAGGAYKGSKDQLTFFVDMRKNSSLSNFKQQAFWGQRDCKFVIRSGKNSCSI